MNLPSLDLCFLRHNSREVRISNWTLSTLPVHGTFLCSDINVFVYNTLGLLTETVQNSSAFLVHFKILKHNGKMRIRFKKA